MPAASSASSSTRPAGPTNGAPSRSSRSPGCSPTSTIAGRAGPAPNTVCVAFFQSGHARQRAAAARSAAIDTSPCIARSRHASGSGDETAAERALARAPRPGSGAVRPDAIRRPRSRRAGSAGGRAAWRPPCAARRRRRRASRCGRRRCPGPRSSPRRLRRASSERSTAPWPTSLRSAWPSTITSRPRCERR